MMTKKHFEALANNLKQIPNYTDRKTAIDCWVEVCKDMNPRFDEKKFRKACED